MFFLGSPPKTTGYKKVPGTVSDLGVLYICIKGRCLVGNQRISLNRCCLFKGVKQVDQSLFLEAVGP